jgi:hypothetical protein
MGPFVPSLLCVASFLIKTRPVQIYSDSRGEHGIDPVSPARDVDRSPRSPPLFRGGHLFICLGEKVSPFVRIIGMHPDDKSLCNWPGCRDRSATTEGKFNSYVVSGRRALSDEVIRANGVTIVSTSNAREKVLPFAPSLSLFPPFTVGGFLLIFHSRGWIASNLRWHSFAGFSDPFDISRS